MLTRAARFSLIASLGIASGSLVACGGSDGAPTSGGVDQGSQALAKPLNAGIDLVVMPGSVTFTVKEGTKKNQVQTLTWINDSGPLPRALAFKIVPVKGSDRAITIVDDKCTKALASGKTCKMGVEVDVAELPKPPKCGMTTIEATIEGTGARDSYAKSPSYERAKATVIVEVIGTCESGESDAGTAPDAGPKDAGEPEPAPKAADAGPQDAGTDASDAGAVAANLAGFAVSAQGAGNMTMTAALTPGTYDVVGSNYEYCDSVTLSTDWWQPEMVGSYAGGCNLAGGSFSIAATFNDVTVWDDGINGSTMNARGYQLYFQQNDGSVNECTGGIWGLFPQNTFMSGLFSLGGDVSGYIAAANGSFTESGTISIQTGWSTFAGPVTFTLAASGCTETPPCCVPGEESPVCSGTCYAGGAGDDAGFGGRPAGDVSR